MREAREAREARERGKSGKRGKREVRKRQERGTRERLVRMAAARCCAMGRRGRGSAKRANPPKKARNEKKFQSASSSPRSECTCAEK
jgi:hypothetical protein